MHCTTCDHANPADARFCLSCGAALAAAPVATPAVASPVALGALATPSALTAPLMPAAPAPIAMPQINVNVVTQAAPAMPVVVLANQASGPGCLVRGLYFVFVGLWLGALWTGFAWFLLVSVLGLPLGIMMLNRLPQVMTLKPQRTQMNVTVQNGVVVVGQSAAQQLNFFVRALYFVFVGWWFSGLWLGTAWGLMGATFGLALPLSFWMFDRTPAIVTLARS